MGSICTTCKATYRPSQVCINCYNKYVKSIKEHKIHAENAEKLLKRRIEDLGKKAGETEELIEDLNSSLTFLRSYPPPLTDVVLVASDDPSPLPVPANRAILACRSPVFRAMLENEMEESISGSIRIGEVSNDTLSSFVRFMYNAELAIVDDDEKMALDLLMLGEKYQIPHLKTCCEKFLISVLNWENSLPIYAFARQNNSQSLTDASLSLIIKDLQKLTERQDYAQLTEKDPRMVIELYEACNKL